VENAIADAGADFHSSILAVELRERIRVDRPDLWDAWTDLMALDALKTAIGRTRALERQTRSVFRRGAFEISEEVDSSHLQRRFGDMTKPDLDYVYRAYSARARTMRRRADAIRALRDRLPDDLVKLRDVVPEADVAAVFA
jgi:hypothetical protein